jgi:glycosyltransferase involved in cell wall biosynthesis
MRIGVDCHVLAGKYQGSRTYLTQLYTAILEKKQNHQFCFFGHWQGERPFGAEYSHIEFHSQSRWRRMTYQTAPLIQEHEIDCYHCTYIAPLKLGCDRIVTIHDILFESHPQFFTRAERMRNRLLVRVSASSATQIHAGSEYTRQQLTERYGIPKERMHVVPSGVNAQQFHPNGKEGSKQIVQKQFGVRDYLLTVGRLEPRKNHLGLLTAYKQAYETRPGLPQLVIVGQRDFGFDELLTMLNQKPFDTQVKLIEQADQEMLGHLYRAASLFVYPSFAEGFGIPPLEAMASGIPVITSNSTAINETAVGATIQIDPDNTEELADAMLKVLGDSRLQASLIACGIERAKEWTWQASADKYLSAIAELEPLYRSAAPSFR